MKELDTTGRKLSRNVDEGQARQNKYLLDQVYGIVCLDRTIIKKQGQVINTQFYSASSVTQDGREKMLGQWITDTESCEFWLSALIELKNRGVKDISLCCVDDHLTGCTEAVRVVFPKTQVQLFRHDQSASAMKKTLQQWAMTLRNWKPVPNKLTIEYEGNFNIKFTASLTFSKASKIPDSSPVTPES